MGTPYTEIFDAYFLKVKDDLYGAMEREELEIELKKILQAALPRFLYPKVDLNIQDEDGFVEDLTNEEIQILASLMNLIWVESQVSDIGITRQVFRDHDFQLTSQASHLRSLLTLRGELRTLCRDLMQAYYKVNNRTPDFSGLAGGD